MKLSVLSDVHLLPEAQQKIQSLSDVAITFPAEDTQPELEELIKRTSEAEAVLVSPGTNVSRELLEACPSIKYVGICGTSKENVDQVAIEERGITLTNVSHYGDEPAAEFIFMQLVALARGVDSKQWRENPTELLGKSIGIIGLGSLGQAVARLALAYKMQVSYCGPTRKQEYDELGVKHVEKSELLKTSDVVVISSPSNLEVIGAEDFALIKPKTLLVQASTGACFDKAAFLEWVGKDGNCAMFDYSAGNDSYEAYKDLPRVVFPKIVAGYSYEARQRLGERVLENLQAYLNSRV